MKVLQKRISFFVFCLIGLLLFTPFLAAAEDDADNNGKMDLKINRIGGDGAQHYQNTETEKEKRFPNLFSEETEAAIESKQTEAEELMEELEESLFITDTGSADTVVQDTKKVLFTDDYTAPQTASSDSQGEEGNDGLSTALYIGFAGVVSILCVGLYTMFQRFTG